MIDILGIATRLSAGKHHSIRNDDVFIDRLNHRYTVTMILVFAGIVTTQQYFGSPITCWVPAQFTGGYEKYTNDICWIMNTYYVPMEYDIPHAETTRYEQMLKYYQWSPFILLFMALCFYFPRMLWRSLNNKSGLDIEKLVDEAMKQEQKAEKSDEQKKAVNGIANSIRTYVENRYTRGRDPPAYPKNAGQKFWYYLTFWRHRHLSSFIFLLFTFVKFLYTLNALAQIFLLNTFLGNDYHLFGFEVLVKFIRGLDWGESKRFPRVTLCDFHIREIGIVHRYTVQCVLPINLFNEKIFLILWFWILLLGIFNVTDFISWLLRIVRVNGRSKYVQRKLAMNRAARSSPFDGNDWSEERKLYERRLTHKFVREYLQEDGCFALRLLARNGQDILVGQIIDQLYEHYRTKYDPDSEHLNTDRPVPSARSEYLFRGPTTSETPSHPQDRQRLVTD